MSEKAASVSVCMFCCSLYVCVDYCDYGKVI